MKLFKTTLIGSIALVASSASIFADGLIGERYASLSLASDSDFNELAVTIGFNNKLKDGLDLQIEIGESDQGDVIAGMIGVSFYTEIGTDGNWKAYFTSVLGYASIDVNPWFTEKELLYGVAVGSEFELDEKTSIDFSLSILDTQDYGDLGLTGSIEYNYWFTEKFNAGVGASYNTEVDDASFGLIGRWAF